MSATTVVTRASKGSALTHTEMDSNWNNLLGGLAYVGSILMWPADTPPDSKWLELDGSAIASSSYPDLFTLIGYTYGGSGATFNLPDLRGVFARGWSHGSNTDPGAATRVDRGDGTTGDNVGTKQDFMLEDHEHISEVATVGSQGGGSRIDAELIGGSSQLRILAPTTGNHGAETRPKNIALMYIIKALK
jgi:phage-related tail fiber protein